MPGLPFSMRIGNDVIGHGGQTADEGLTTDTGELVHGAAAAEDGLVTDVNMASQHDIVGQDDVIAENAVMGDMRIGQEQAVVADAGDPATADRAAVHRHAFAYGAILTNDQCGIFTRLVKALRDTADHGHRVDLGAGADFGQTGHDSVRNELDAVFQRHARANPAEGTDTDILADHRSVFDHGHRMDDGACGDLAHF